MKNYISLTFLPKGHHFKKNLLLNYPALQTAKSIIPFLGFECPYGIKIFKIYVTKQQYVKIMEVANCSPYKMNTLDTKQSSSKSNSSRKRIAKLQVTYNNKGSSSFHLGSRESLLSDNSFDNNSSFSRSLSDSLETVSSSSDNTSTANLLSQTEDSTEDLNSKLFSPISTTTTKTTTENIQDREEHVLANDVRITLYILTSLVLIE